MERWSTGWASISRAVSAGQFSLPSLPRIGFQVGLASLLLLAGVESVRAATADNETRTLSVATKGRQGGVGSIATSTGMAAASVDKPWMRILLLSPSITDSTSVTTLGNEDLTLMRTFFVKPQTVVKIGFSHDPMMGMTCDHFSGSTNVKLKTVSFAQHSAALQRTQ